MLNLHASEKNHFIHFPEDAQKICCFESFRKILESTFSKVPFRLLEISNLQSMNTLKTVSTANVFC